MRLDHLLSKETSSSDKLEVTFLGQNSGEGMRVMLFNLEGARRAKEVRELRAHSSAG